MSPQHSNRDKLLRGAMRCLERLPLERITARVIAEESGANAASIVYHFGSKDELITAAIIAGLDQWLDDVSQGLAAARAATPEARFRQANAVLTETRQRHLGLLHNFVAAIARSPHDDRVRNQLAAGFHRTRPAVAALLHLGDDQTGRDAGGVVLALFYGLILQVLLDPDLALDGRRLDEALQRVALVLP